jgi:ribonucleoside-diphosphate reductase alpha chain
MGQISVDLSAKMEPLQTEPTQPGNIGVTFPRYFTARLAPGKTPYDEVRWETRTASIGNDKGAVIFEQRDIEVPADWSQTATNIVASKYFHGKLGSPERESSVAQLVERVVDTIAGWGRHDGYFRGEEDAENFRAELAHLMLTQKACFNSPVWFNVGVREARGYGWVYDRAAGRIRKLEAGQRIGRSARPASSTRSGFAGVDSRPGQDRGHAVQVGLGTGTNLSPLREEDAVLSGGGRASGPLSFMKGFDAFAGVIKSGGKTRRAAKMVILNTDHPGHRAVHLVQGQGREEGHCWSRPATTPRSTAKPTARSSSRTPTTACARATISCRRWWRTRTGGPRPSSTAQPAKRYKARDLLRAIADATGPVRRPRHAVRYHGQPLAHVQELGAHQRLEPMLGVHVPGRFGVQPGVAEPDEVLRPDGQFDVKHSGTRWIR